jgi:hypothetical protein
MQKIAFLAIFSVQIQWALSFQTPGWNIYSLKSNGWPSRKSSAVHQGPFLFSSTTEMDLSSLKPVILAPAQFGIPDDYRELSGLLENRGYRLFVAPLSRFDWYAPPDLLQIRN